MNGLYTQHQFILGFMQVDNKIKTIKEFLEGSEEYIKTLKRCDGELCFVCGMKAESYEKLVNAVKILKEKAWKYDELSK